MDLQELRSHLIDIKWHEVILQGNRVKLIITPCPSSLLVSSYCTPFVIFDIFVLLTSLIDLSPFPSSIHVQLNKKKNATVKKLPPRISSSRTQRGCNQRDILPTRCDSKPLMSNKMEADLEHGVTPSVAPIGSHIVLNAADGGKTARAKLRRSERNTEEIRFARICWSGVSENDTLTGNYRMCVCSQRPSVSFTAKDSKSSGLYRCRLILLCICVDEKNGVFAIRSDVTAQCAPTHCCVAAVLSLLFWPHIGITSLWHVFGHSFYFHKASTKLKRNKTNLLDMLRISFLVFWCIVYQHLISDVQPGSAGSPLPIQGHQQKLNLQLMLGLIIFPFQVAYSICLKV